MAEYLRIASSEQMRAKNGNLMLVSTLADGSKVYCFDTALFPQIQGQAAIQAELEKSGKAPKITAVLAGGPVPSANGSATVGKPSDRDVWIMRQVALKAAVEAQGVRSDTQTDDEYIADVRKLADSFLDWLENPMPF